MPTRLPRHYWLRVKRSFNRLARGTGTADQIALGAAIGVFVAFTPTVGLQMLIAAGIATLARANRLAAILPVWITNPVTIVPIYSFAYLIGRKLVGGPGLATFRQTFGDVIRHAQTEGLTGLPETMRKLFGLGMHIQAPLWLGCTILGLLLALPSYFLMRVAVRRFRARWHRKRAARQARVDRITADQWGSTPDEPAITFHPDAPAVETPPPATEQNVSAAPEKEEPK